MKATFCPDVERPVHVDAVNAGGSGRLIVVACRTIGSVTLEREIRRSLARGTSHVHLIVPLREAAMSIATACQTPELPAFGSPRDLAGPVPAGEMVHRGVGWLRGIGATASGEIVGRDLAGAIGRAVTSWHAHEVLISRIPSATWRKHDLADRVRRRVDVPIRTVAPTLAHDSLGQRPPTTPRHGGL